MVLLAIGLLMAAAAAPPAPVRGDFDKDGRVDVAEVVVEGMTARLVVRPGSGGPAQTVTTWRTSDLAGLYVEMAPPGRSRTACDKGMGDDNADCSVRLVDPSGDTLAFGSREASMAVAVWNGRGFEVHWLSD